MKYQCLNENCKKTFMTPAKKTETLTENITQETSVCPHYQSVNYEEAQLQPLAQPQIESVYIYDLTSGKQEALDKLLSEGYVIVNRFSKQYHLEKPKKEA
jgi:hypothetical protein